MKREYRQHGEIVAVHDSEEETVTLLAPEQPTVRLERCSITGVTVGTCLILDDEGDGEQRPVALFHLEGGDAIALPLDTAVEVDDLARRATGYLEDE